MAGPVLIDRAAIEVTYGVTAVAQMVDAAGDVTYALQVASDVGWGALRGGFTAAEIVVLGAEDTAVREALAKIAMDVLARRRHEFNAADGKTPYAVDRAAAEKYLHAVADGNPRTVAEAAGADPSKLLRNRYREPPVSLLEGGGF